MIKIEKPKPEDAKAIQQVFYVTWKTTYPNKEAGISLKDIEERFKNKLSKQALKKRAEDIANIAENKLLLVAKEDDTVVGVCRLVKREDFNKLEAIYVLPNYQRRGIGKMFWREVQNYFGNEKDIIVEVATYNEQAINFYKKLGFVDTGVRFAEEQLRMPISGVCIPEMRMIIRSVK